MGLFSGVPIIGDALNYIQGRDDSKTAADHAADRSDASSREQMAFQRDMSNTAYQRATEDMKKAGLNPMLAFQQGGASTPSGSSNTAPMAKIPELGNVFTSALEYQKTAQDIETGQSTKALNDAMASKSLVDAQLAAANTRSADVNVEATKSQLAAIKARAEADEKKAKYDAKASGYDAIMSRLNRDSGSAKNLMNLFKPGATINNFGKDSFIDKSTGEILRP